jgi:2-isopropylmalate synthase
VTVRIDAHDRTFVGRSADTDIVVASAKALMNALNRAIAQAPREPQEAWSNP